MSEYSIMCAKACYLHNALIELSNTIFIYAGFCMVALNYAFLSSSFL